MTTAEKQKVFYDKVIYGLERTYQKLIDEKKKNNSYLVVIRNNKIVNIKP
jgi:hypothetical protein